MAEEPEPFEKPFSRMTVSELEAMWDYWTRRIQRRSRIDSVTCAMVSVRDVIEDFIALRRRQMIGGLE